jgi:quercetin dioxygenase-like cupin family protein
MDYVRLYADEHGETHFEDVSPAMVAERYAGAEWLISQPLRVGDLRFRRVTVEFGDEPHVAPCRQLIVALTGESEVEVSDGETRRFGPGSVILVEDTTGKGHRTRRIGDTIRETLFISLPE